MALSLGVPAEVEFERRLRSHRPNGARWRTPGSSREARLGSIVDDDIFRSSNGITGSAA
jgi:hypothetical protein